MLAIKSSAVCCASRLIAMSFGQVVAYIRVQKQHELEIRPSTAWEVLRFPPVAIFCRRGTSNVIHGPLGLLIPHVSVVKRFKSVPG